MDRRRRPRTPHRHRGFHDGAILDIEIGDCRALLDGGQVRDDVQLLLLETVLRTGRTTITFGELKQLLLDAVAASGGTKAAIKAVKSGAKFGAKRKRTVANRPG
jgi:hypothetical protein